MPGVVVDEARTQPVSPQSLLFLLAGWNELLIASFSHRSVSVQDGILLATGLHVHRSSAHSAGVGSIFDRWLSSASVCVRMRVHACVRIHVCMRACGPVGSAGVWDGPPTPLRGARSRDPGTQRNINQESRGRLQERLK